jgi:hypothetical protein
MHGGVGGGGREADPYPDLGAGLEWARLAGTGSPAAAFTERSLLDILLPGGQVTGLGRLLRTPISQRSVTHSDQ